MLTNAPKLGQTVIIPGNWDIPVQIQAISYKWDIQDIAVVWAKSDEYNQIVAEWDINRNSYGIVTTFANTEEAVISYVNRAFGISV
jgi:hypothetical protein